MFLKLKNLAKTLSMNTSWLNLMIFKDLDNLSIRRTEIENVNLNGSDGKSRKRFNRTNPYQMEL